tara:strand:- start:176 stop:577 length:402 start_codon:yes stop_codon:yes gene_type:complete
MKKTLLLAAALACSGVAQAEIWQCNSTHASSISDYGMPLLSQEYAQGEWLVDTNQGLLRGEEESIGLFRQEFEGTCNTYKEKFIRCEVSSLKEDAVILSILIVDTVWSKYSYSSIGIQHTAGVNSQIGTCTKA